MRVGFLHSLIRKEEKLLLDELTRHPEAEVVMLDDRGLIFDLQRAPEVDVVLERGINHSRAPRIIHLIEAPGFLADRDDPDSRVPHLTRDELARREQEVEGRMRRPWCGSCDRSGSWSASS